jgi:hypothetical protein
VVGLGHYGGPLGQAATAVGDGIKSVTRAIEDGAKSLWGALSSL